jgi:hypothetical protein
VTEPPVTSTEIAAMLLFFWTKADDSSPPDSGLGGWAASAPSGPRRPMRAPPDAPPVRDGLSAWCR